MNIQYYTYLTHLIKISFLLITKQTNQKLMYNKHNKSKKNKAS